MRKLVVSLVALLALFTFIRDLKATSSVKTPTIRSEIKASLIP